MLLSPVTSEQRVEARMPAIHRKYHGDFIADQKRHGVYDSTRVSTYDLKRIRAIHLSGDSDPVYSYILSGIALAVLLIACINFMILSIGRSARRAQEVGVRKVVGAGRRQVMAQFLGEALLLTVIALGLGMLLAAAFLPVFNQLTEKQLAIGSAFTWTSTIAMLAIVLITGLVAGGYPAVVLSRFQLIETLRNRLRPGRTSGFTRSLVVVQFAFTVFLITSTLVMTRQLAYTRSLNLGFDKEQIVVIPTPGLDGGEIAEQFRTELDRYPRIVGVTASGNRLGRTGSMGRSYPIDGKRHSLSYFRVDEHYVDFLGLELVAGRKFRSTGSYDPTSSVIVNEALVRDFGLENPIGQTIPRPPQAPGSSELILGLVKDYHFQSLYHEVGSVVLLFALLFREGLPAAKERAVVPS